MTTRNRFCLGVLAPALVLALSAGAQAAETASAQIALTSSSGPNNTYTISLKDTGTTPIGTFWFAWTPQGYDFLPSQPTAIGSSVAGWSGGATPNGQGYGIEWLAGTPIASGGSGTFTFTSPDSLATITGNSSFLPGTATSTAEIYSGGAFSDAGTQFVVTAAPTPEPASLGLLGAGLAALALRRRRNA